MKDMIKKAFDEVHADSSLKEKTLQRVLEKSQRRSAGFLGIKTLVPAMICMLLLVSGSLKLYYTPTVVISIDINPSVELSVNRFDRVVSSVGVNADGRELLNSISLTNLNYADAIGEIMKSGQITALLSNDEIMEIGVVGDGDQQEKRIYSDLEKYTKDDQNVSCYATDHHELETAHHMGMSCGKYRAYSVLMEEGTDITPEEAQNMTMHQLKDLSHDSHHGSGDGSSHCHD